jgi:hypothetical protein
VDIFSEDYSESILIDYSKRWEICSARFVKKSDNKMIMRFPNRFLKDTEKIFDEFMGYFEMVSEGRHELEVD